MTPASHLSPAVRVRAVAALWLANAAFGIALGSGYLRHVPEVEGAALWFFALAALVSTVVTLTAVPGALFLGAARWSLGVRWLGPAQALVWSAFHVLLFADTRIYNVFRYHFGPQVWNLLYTRGSEDSVHLGWRVWLAVGGGFAVVALCEFLLWRRFLARAESLRTERRAPRRMSALPAAFIVLFACVFVDKTIYAQADLTRDRQVTALSRVFPLYARLPVEDLASRVLGVELEEDRPRFEVDGVEFAAPTPPPIPAGDHPNVFVIVIDCWRSDMLTPEAAPELSAFAASARRFEDHVSGGNSTRYGLFSMLYGLPGSYWFPVLAERRSPVLLDALLDAGYDARVFSSASMNYPELRSTAWARLPDRVHDDFPALQAWKRDEQAAEACVDWWHERRASGSDAPFFGFVLLDSAHQTYSYPSEGAAFQPTVPDIDYLAISSAEGPPPGMLERVRNRYRNAVRHADRVAGALLEELEALGEAENTVVLVTGDHGEEFLEHGFFGHTSSFTPEQVRVPLLARGPGIDTGVETRPTTHLDVPATLLELLGADPALRASYTCGATLLDPPEQRVRVLSGWNELGLWTDDAIIRIPLSLFEFDLECYDYEWHFLAEDSDVLLRHADGLQELAADCNRFLR